MIFQLKLQLSTGIAAIELFFKIWIFAAHLIGLDKRCKIEKFYQDENSFACLKSFCPFSKAIIAWKTFKNLQQQYSVIFLPEMTLSRIATSLE